MTTEKWIDVSAHNGYVDYAQVAAAGITGVIIRAGYGSSYTQKDRFFDANIQNAINAGLKVAVYWFSYADSKKNAIVESTVCKNVISPYKSHILFVAFDYEYDSVRYYKQIHGAAPSNRLINEIAVAFLEAIKADGYTTALYSNNDYRRNVFYSSTIAAADLFWLADYTGGPDVSCAIQQTSSKGKISGISGYVDLNTVYVPLGVLNYTCDTSGVVEVARGKAYQALITSSNTPTIVAGTKDVVVILHRYTEGNKRYYYFVPIGNKGAETGIYINGGNRQFIIRIV